MTPLHKECLKKMCGAHLHLIDSGGFVLSADIRAACETAFKRVVQDFPNFDQALIADWAEEVAASMDERGESIQFPRRYAYMALRGKIRDWSKTGPGRAELKGIRPDPDEVGSLSESFTDQIERKVLFEQILPALSERDRAILVLLLNEESTTSIASFLNTNYAAAAKAMQRMKDRVSVVLNGRRHKAEVEPEVDELRLARGIGSGS